MFYHLYKLFISAVLIYYHMVGFILDLLATIFIKPAEFILSRIEDS